LAKSSHFYKRRDFATALKEIENAESVVSKQLQSSKESLRNSGGLSKLLKKHDVTVVEKNLLIVVDRKIATLNKLQKYDDSIAEADDILEQNPDQWKFWIRKGEAELGLKKYDQSLESFNQSLKFLKKSNVASERNKINKVWKFKNAALQAKGESYQFCFNCEAVVNTETNEPKLCVLPSQYFHNNGTKTFTVQKNDEANHEHIDEWQWSCCNQTGKSRISLLEDQKHTNIFQDAPGCCLKRTKYGNHRFVKLN